MTVFRYLITIGIISVIVIVSWGVTDKTTAVKQDYIIKTTNIVEAFHQAGKTYAK